MFAKFIEIKNFLIMDTYLLNQQKILLYVTNTTINCKNLTNNIVFQAKLESYRELQNSGKDLNSDQKTAVAKYDEVIQTLDFAKDLYKQFLAIASASEKESKKLARKEALARGQSELAKIRDVLLVQDALAQLGREEVREDFLAGRNGAAALTQTDLNLLDELYPAVTPRHEAGDATAFATQVQTAAEHLLAVVDGKPKEAFGGTYAQIKEVCEKRQR